MPTYFTHMESPLGPLLLAADESGLRYLGFVKGKHPAKPDPAWQNLDVILSEPLLRTKDPSQRPRSSTGNANRTIKREASILREAASQLRAYFSGERETFDLPLSPEGTPFQLKVWKLLCDIPYAETISYGEIARRAGNPKASRAVGLANGSNPLAIVVPCHRVIGSNGKLTGYGGGLPNKEKLLALERRQLRLL